MFVDGFWCDALSQIVISFEHNILSNFDPSLYNKYITFALTQLSFLFFLLSTYKHVGSSFLLIFLPQFLCCFQRWQVSFIFLVCITAGLQQTLVIGMFIIPLLAIIWSFTILTATIVSTLIGEPWTGRIYLLIENPLSGSEFPWRSTNIHIANLDNFGNICFPVLSSMWRSLYPSSNTTSSIPPSSQSYY